MATVLLKEVTKKYGNIKAVSKVSLKIEDDEYLCLLGPSGCGKTTLLRLISGLTFPSEGRILIDDQEVTDLPVYKRDIAIVFQNYALFPHMTISENVSFGLRMQKMEKELIRKRVDDALSLVGLTETRDRYPKQLSGGQQQRIALARAIVLKPKVLLLDEPLSNLDAKLRKQMRTELKKLHREINITTIHVTHDQEEALSIADRIVVMRNGEVQQIGAPQEIYESPGDSFMAEFIGSANLLNGVIIETIPKGNEVFYRLDLKSKFQVLVKKKSSGAIGDTILVGIRPEKLNVHRQYPSEEMNVLHGRIGLFHYLGAILEIHVDVNGTELIANVPATMGKDLGPMQDVYISCNPDDFFVVRN
jgi:spermidine/putrescine ABC transporter ATP-binding subunit